MEATGINIAAAELLKESFSQRLKRQAEQRGDEK
jgi:hypothetical protein